ncbi:hypothetical protein M3Y97_01055900 [Aphelenchoides bicaudatus]|nr:hypothetical protein M3Y97_01055900 [Aphelenchoides bicaudatus]
MIINKPPLTILADGVDYPDVNECFNWKTTRPSQGCPNPGLFVEMASLIATRLNMTARFINSEDQDFILTFGANKNISDSTLGGELLRNGTVDLLEMYFDKHDELGEGFTITNPVYYSTTKFIVARSSSSLTGAFDFFTVYDAYIWGGIFTCLFLVILIYLLIYQVGAKLTVNESTTFSNFAWQMFRLQLAQIDNARQKLMSSNCLLLVFALFQAGLIIRMYNNLITTQAVRYVDPKPFKENELLQVLKEKKYSFIFHKKVTWWHEAITTSMESPYFEIREAIENNPIRIAEDYEKDNDLQDAYVMNHVRDGKWITIGSNEDIAVYRHDGYCNMIYIDTNFPPKQKSLLMRSNHPLLKRINEIIIDETINIRRLHHKYYKYARPPKCEQAPNKTKALTLTPFFGVMLIFLAGTRFIYYIDLLKLVEDF